MLKRTVKFLAIVLVAVTLILSFASCKQSDAPKGYQLVACEGDKFRLYVPTQAWMPNTTGGVTSAFFSQSENTSVSVYIADDAGEMTAEEYANYCNEKFAAELDGYKLIGTEKCVLGGVAAIKSVFVANNLYQNREGAFEKVAYQYMQVMARYDGDMYILTYTAPEEFYESHLEDVEGNDKGEGIIPYFTFASAYSSGEEKKYSDKVEVPEGMKLISTDERAYRFFVPTEWQINKRTDISAAYYSESDRSNVSVQIYICGTGDAVKDVDTYFARCEASYKDMFAEYELISSENIAISNLNAKRYVIAVSTGEIDYKVLQAIVKKGDAIYCLTYTATAENYDAHVSDVEKMIEVFEIR